MAIYEYPSMDELQRFRQRPDIQAARDDAAKQVGVLVKAWTSKLYPQIYPK